jgi:hypothetical protein
VTVFWRRKPSPVVALLALVRAETDLPAPEATLENDGDLSFDWDLAREASLTVWLHPSGRGGGYAALIGEWKSYGKFHDISRSVEVPIALQRLARRVREREAQ